MRKNLKHISVVIVFLSLIACEKDWLEEKRSLSLIVPTTLKDMRLLLNNATVLANDYAGLLEVSGDDYYLTNTTYQALSFLPEKNAHIWAKDVFEGTPNVQEWNNAYNQILITNVILEGLDKIRPDNSNQAEYNDIKGGALFFRAKAFFNIAQLFAKPYDKASAANDPGIPLKLTADVNEKISRQTLQQTYDRIIEDLTTAIELLRLVPAFKTDGSKPAAAAILARCYLSMGDYSNALVYTDMALKTYNTVLDFNTLNPSLSLPVPYMNEEVILFAPLTPTYSSFRPTSGFITNDLFNSYHQNDLRRGIYFTRNTDGTIGFKGNFTGTSALFSGVATGELYLIRAEGHARAGNIVAAMNDLNTLLVKRFKTGTFQPVTAANAQIALDIVLQERRKELLRRGLRWTDLRRLNKETRYAVTLKRVINGQEYLLPPNDVRYVLPIPDYIIQANGIAQNPR